MLAYQVAILSLFNHNHLLTHSLTYYTMHTHSLTYSLTQHTTHYTPTDTIIHYTLDTMIHERLFVHHIASLVNPYQYTIIYPYIHTYLSYISTPYTITVNATISRYTKRQGAIHLHLAQSFLLLLFCNSFLFQKINSEIL